MRRLEASPQRPALHGPEHVAFVCPVEPQKPAWQRSVAAVERGGQKYPATQVTGVPVPLPQKLPAGHGDASDVVLPAGQNSPGRQGPSHIGVVRTDEARPNVPALQSPEQDEFVLPLAPHVPAAHKV